MSKRAKLSDCKCHVNGQRNCPIHKGLPKYQCVLASYFHDGDLPWRFVRGNYPVEKCTTPVTLTGKTKGAPRFKSERALRQYVKAHGYVYVQGVVLNKSNYKKRKLWPLLDLA